MTNLSAFSRRTLLAGGVSAALAAPFLAKGLGVQAQSAAKPGTVIGATCKATTCNTDDDCGSGCECGEDSKCAAGD